MVENHGSIYTNGQLTASQLLEADSSAQGADARVLLILHGDQQERAGPTVTVMMLCIDRQERGRKTAQSREPAEKHRVRFKEVAGG